MTVQNASIGTKSIALSSHDKGLRKKAKKLNNAVMANGVLSPDQLERSKLVPQSHFGFVQAKDDKNVLITENVHQCYAIILYDPITKIAAMTHIDYQTKPASIEKFINKMNEKTGSPPLKVHLVGGEATINCPLSKSNERKVVKALKKYNNLDIASWDTRGKTHPTDIAFDSVTGKTYSIKDSPLHRRYALYRHLREDGRGIDYGPVAKKLETMDVSSREILFAQIQERWRCLMSGGKKKYIPSRPLAHVMFNNLPQRDLLDANRPRTLNIKHKGDV